MKVAALAAVSVLIVFPVEAGQRHQSNNVSPFCYNYGRCTTFSVTAPTSNKAPSLRGRTAHRAVDSNCNIKIATLKPTYGFNITVEPAYTSQFLQFYALL